MKEIYELLNEMDIDIREENKMEVSQIEKAKVKRQLRNRINNTKTKPQKIKRLISAAAIAMAISIPSLIGLSLTSYAEGIPIIGDIFKIFKDAESSNVFEHYRNHSTVIGEKIESNGISVTITDAVYDGESVTITYLIESKKDLGTRPVLEGDFAVKGLGDKDNNLYSLNNIIEKINAHQYAVISIYEFIDGPKPSELRVNWQGESIIDFNNANNKTAGNWSFEFSLIALEQESQRFADRNINTEEQGVKVSAVEMTETPISTTFYLSEKVDISTVAMEEEEWRGVQIEYMVTDNLGNEYDKIHFFGTGHSTDFSEGHRSTPRITTTVIHEDATSIMITPFIHIYRMVNSEGWLELVKQPYSIRPIVVPLSE